MRSALRLATVRNLRRNPDYSVERLADLCIDKEYASDIRLPDWPRILSPLLTEGEEVKRTALDAISAEDLYEFRLVALRVGGHVIALINDDDGGFRVYDNDSAERQRGTFRAMRADEVIDRWQEGTVIGTITGDSTFSRRLGAPITTLVHRRARRGATAPRPVPAQAGPQRTPLA